MTLCVAERWPLFTNEKIIRVLLPMLARKLICRQCRADAYCFMLDHLHILITGVREAADAWLAVTEFKQSSGEWLSAHLPGRKWQKGFDARIITAEVRAEAVAAYVLNNPVRAGLVAAWQDYRYSGKIEFPEWSS